MSRTLRSSLFSTTGNAIQSIWLPSSRKRNNVSFYFLFLLFVANEALHVWFKYLTESTCWKTDKVCPRLNTTQLKILPVQNASLNKSCNFKQKIHRPNKKLGTKIFWKTVVVGKWSSWNYKLQRIQDKVNKKVVIIITWSSYPCFFLLFFIVLYM